MLMTIVNEYSNNKTNLLYFFVDLRNTFDTMMTSLKLISFVGYLHTQKILTRENIERSWHKRPNKFPLCKHENETIDHLMIHYPFLSKACKTTLQSLFHRVHCYSNGNISTQATSKRRKHSKGYGLLSGNIYVGKYG